MACPTIINENLCVQAEVRLTPHVTVGDVSTCTLGNPTVCGCPRCPTRSFCSFFVTQKINVEVPLTFHASANAAAGIVCGT